jgi:hypothetical protein
MLKQRPPAYQSEAPKFPKQEPVKMYVANNGESRQLYFLDKRPVWTTKQSHPGNTDEESTKLGQS